VRLGLARTFQGGRLFPHLTALQNVQLGAVGRGESRRSSLAVAQDLLERLGVAHRAGAPAQALPHGDERKVGIARALAGRPSLLFLDEPAAGLNESESDELLEALRGIRGDFELGILLIEHDVRLVLTLSDRVHVLDEGKTLAIGSPDEVRNDERVITAYLGPQAVEADA
jgi:branched-chain amino acid transport system ATP-binding protein